MVEIDPSGALTTEDNLPDIKLGSVFPKANLAWNNRFEWRGISLSALFTARIGGIAYSATQAAMDQYGVSERSAQARDNGGVLLNGRTLVDAQTYYSLIGNSSGLPQYYTFTALRTCVCKKPVWVIPFPANGWEVCVTSMSLW